MEGEWDGGQAGGRQHEITSRRSPIYLVILLVAGLGCAGLAVAAGPDGVGRFGFGALQVAVLVGVLGAGVIRPARRSKARVLLLAGLAATAVANLAFAVWWHAALTRSADVIDAVQLVAYLPIGGAFLVMLRRRRARREVESIIDGSILGAALAVICWQLLLSPGASPAISSWDRFVAGIYPVLDVVLIVMAIHLAVGRGRGRMPWRLLVLGTVAMGTADFFQSARLLTAGTRLLWQLQTIRATGILILTVAIGQYIRTSAHLQPGASSRQPVRIRVSLLVLPLLIGPGILLLQGHQLDADSRAVVVISISLGAIVIIRLAKLGHELSAARRRELTQDQWFESLVRNAKDSILVLDRAGRITWLSPAVPELLGFPAASLVGEQVFDFVHPGDRDETERRMIALVQTPGESGQVHVRVRHHEGSWRRVEAHVVNLLHDPVVAGIVVNQRDVTDWYEADSAVRHRAAQQEAVASLSRRALEGAEPVALAEQAVAIVRDNLEVSSCQFFRVQEDDTSVVLEAVAVEPGVAAGRTGILSLPAFEGTFAHFAVSSPSPVICGIREHEDRFDLPTDMGDTTFASTMSASVTGRHNPHGILVVQSVEYRAFHAPDALFLHAVANALALALERRQAEDETRHLALHDTLTGLPNRALFLDRLQLALSRGQRSRSSLAVLFLDLDHFKVVNDSLGHDAGDRLLVAVARRLSGILRPGDTVARFGGDEFTILCEGIAGSHEAIEIAERINGLLADPLRVGPAELHTTASIGIAVTAGRATRPESLLRDADAAMYRAKDAGRARYELFDATMRDQALSRLRIETALRQAVTRDELELHYQPVVDLRTGTTAGAEALVRWNHPERGFILPGEFIPVAEETGLIDSVGRWVLDQACRQAARWAATEKTNNLVVSVNVSARALVDPQFVHMVRSHLDQYALDPSLLCLEITESVLMGNVEVSLAALRRLKDLGIAIAVDDFGTGYSSLAYLKRFPVDVLKVDRSFVAGLGEHSEDTAIVETVITLASTLGLMAIAEGVETQQQLAELTSLGCDLAQGFYFATPKSVSEFELDLTATDATLVLPRDRSGHPSARGALLRAAIDLDGKPKAAETPTS